MPSARWSWPQGLFESWGTRPDGRRSSACYFAARRSTSEHDFRMGGQGADAILQTCSWPGNLLAVAAHAGMARGQGYGSDLQNVMAPASGGMAGVSVARPQDVPSAIFGNPATLAQFEGTQFTLGGGWMEGYPTVTNDGSAIGGVPSPPRRGPRAPRPPRSAWPRTFAVLAWPAPSAWASPASAAAGPSTSATCRAPYQQR